MNSKWTEKAELKGATLYLGNCLQVDLAKEGIDAVVTDPPYGMNYKRAGRSKKSISTNHKGGSDKIIGDDEPFDPAPWVKWPAAMTGAHWFYDRLPPGGTIHTWDKRGPYDPVDQADVDQIWCSKRTPARKLECVWRGICRKAENNDKIVHPTQKPVMVMAWMMDLLGIPAGATVLDPYMGSGTTGVAAIRTGRKFIGVEIDREHFQTAKERIQGEIDGRLL